MPSHSSSERPQISQRNLRNRVPATRLRRSFDPACLTCPTRPAQTRPGSTRGYSILNAALVAAGHPAPLNLISEAMGVSKETVKTRLRVARSRVQQGGK